MSAADAAPIVDTDVHQAWASPDVLQEYLAPEWREFFIAAPASAPNRGSGRVHPPHVRYPQISGVAIRTDAAPAVGGPPGSHYETMRDQHLDPHGITRALLTWNYGMHAGLHNAGAASALLPAANDHMVDYWLGQGDDRLRGTIYAPVGVPDEAAKEIHRLADHPLVAAVLLGANPFHKPFGHPIYDPIYRAAVEHDLPIIAHLGSEYVTTGTAAAGGLPTTKVEYYTLGEQPAMHHVTSLLSEGTLRSSRRCGSCSTRPASPGSRG